MLFIIQLFVISCIRVKDELELKGSGVLYKTSVGVSIMSAIWNYENKVRYLILYTYLLQLFTRFARARESELRKVRLKSDKFCDERLRTVTWGLYKEHPHFPSLFLLFLLLSKVSRLLCYLCSPVYTSNWSLVVPSYSHFWCPGYRYVVVVLGFPS